MEWDTPGVDTWSRTHTQSDMHAAKNQSGHILWSLKFGVDVFLEFLPMKASLGPLRDDKVA